MTVRIAECDRRIEDTNAAFLGPNEPSIETVRNAIQIREEAEREKEKIYAEHGMGTLTDSGDMSARELSRMRADSHHQLLESLGGQPDYYHLPPEQALALAEVVYFAREAAV